MGDYPHPVFGTEYSTQIFDPFEVIANLTVPCAQLEAVMAEQAPWADEDPVDGVDNDSDGEVDEDPANGLNEDGDGLYEPRPGCATTATAATTPPGPSTVARVVVLFDGAGGERAAPP